MALLMSTVVLRFEGPCQRCAATLNDGQETDITLLDLGGKTTAKLVKRRCPLCFLVYGPFWAEIPGVGEILLSCVEKTTAFPYHGTRFGHQRRSSLAGGSFYTGRNHS